MDVKLVVKISQGHCIYVMEIVQIRAHLACPHKSLLLKIPGSLLGRGAEAWMGRSGEILTSSDTRACSYVWGLLKYRW